MIGQHLKDYKKKFLRDSKENHCRKNKDWYQRWMPMIKYDHDFDGGFFVELIVHKLHIMLDYYEHGKYCMQIDKSRLEIVDSLKEACRLGDMIVDDNFSDDAYTIMEAHMSMYSTPCKDDPSCNELHIKWDSEEAHEVYNHMMKKAHEEEEKTIKEFFKYIGDHYREWWD